MGSLQTVSAQGIQAMAILGAVYNPMHRKHRPEVKKDTNNPSHSTLFTDLAGPQIFLLCAQC